MQAKDKIARLPLGALQNAANTAVDVSDYKLGPSDPKPDSARARNINCEMALLEVMATSVVELHAAKEAAEEAAAAAQTTLKLAVERAVAAALANNKFADAATTAAAIDAARSEAAAATAAADTATAALAAYKIEAAAALAAAVAEAERKAAINLAAAQRATTDAVAKVKKTAEDAHHMAAAAKAVAQLAYLLRQLVKTTLKGFTGKTLRDRAETAWKMVQKKDTYSSEKVKRDERKRMVDLLCKMVDDGNETVHPDFDVAAELSRMIAAKELVGHNAVTAQMVLTACAAIIAVRTAAPAPAGRGAAAAAAAGGARAPAVAVAPAAAAGAGAPAASAAAAGGAGAATPDDDGWTTVGPRGTKVATSPATVPSGVAAPVAAAGTGSAKAGASAASSVWVAAVRKAT